MRYIYLDWNVIQYMKNSTVQGSINGPEFSNLVCKLSNKYQFPFSEGHLRDLAINFKPENKLYIDKDLDYLNKISNGYVLEIRDDFDTLATTNNVNINEVFSEILNEQRDKPVLDISDKEYSIDYKNISNDDIFIPHLENNNCTLNRDAMHSLLQEIWININNPKYYKKFRNQVLKLRDTFQKRSTIIDKNSDYYKGLLPLLNFISSNNPLEYQDNFEDIIKSFLSINGRILDERKIGQKIELAYMLLDYNPYFMEKVNNKNRPSNINRDCKNLFFASQAKYYITEDKSTLRKANFVIKALSMKVKVTTMNDFLARFC